jgi:hypothetical protein
MKVHLRYTHQKELVTKLPLSGKGFDMNYMTAFVIDIMKRKHRRTFMITGLQNLLHWRTNYLLK